MATLNFTVAYATTLSGLEGQVPSLNVYAEDLGNCSVCTEITSSCWACLTVEQQVFNDVNLTSPVSDGYYLLKYETGFENAIWHIEGGYPQPEGFFN